jgi:prolyl-tRNA synthetase
MRTRLFLRTAEFFRRAYCSCHKSRGCGRVRKMMNVYADFAENFMAIPVIKG